MSFIAVAEIDGISYHVFEMELTTYKPEDARGVKSGVQSSCRTTMVIEASNRVEFIENAIAEPYIPIRQIKIKLYKPNSKGEMRTYIANDSYMVYFKQKFDIYSEHPYTWRITFTSKVMDINGVTQEMNWDALQ